MTRADEDKIINIESEMANRYCDRTELVILNADNDSSESIIRNLRFMAYACGFADGVKYAKDKSIEGDS